MLNRRVLMHPNYSENGFDDCAFLDYEDLNDISLYEIGEYQCPPSYSYGPCVRKHSILHFCLSGHGFLELKGKHYEIRAGEGFLIPSGVSSYYEADAVDPWAYIWFHIGGPLFHDVLERAGLSADHPVFHPGALKDLSGSKSGSAQSQSDASGISRSVPRPEISLDIPYRVYQEINAHRISELYCIGQLMLLCDYLCAESASRKEPEIDPKLQYVKKTIRYIQLHYGESITVEALASVCGLNRSYLSRLFKDATNRTIHEYLLTTRMRKAAQLLREKNTTVQEISDTVGYADIFTFSKAFKKYYGTSPTEYR